MEKIPLILQIIVALGILNVWLLRSGRATPYRGGVAKTLREEFATYGLSFPGRLAARYEPGITTI